MHFIHFTVSEVGFFVGFINYIFLILISIDHGIYSKKVEEGEILVWEDMASQNYMRIK